MLTIKRVLGSGIDGVADQLEVVCSVAVDQDGACNFDLPSAAAKRNERACVDLTISTLPSGTTNLMRSVLGVKTRLNVSM